MFLGFSTINPIITGAERFDEYFPLIKGKNLAMVANQTSVINSEGKYIRLLDKLLEKKVRLKKIFSPEHGFKGHEDAGKHLGNFTDEKTQLPIISLYGKNKEINPKDLKDVDIILFDIQDVGVRFYTYISTLHYVMQAAAKNSKTLILLDRPNPNRHYIDGPILEAKHRSFVGMHPVPVVYGMTIGEYALMVNGEGWLGNGMKCDLKIIPLKNYDLHSRYELPIPPSPNLPNEKSVNLYPSLCFFEGTNVSVGRGTDLQFQVYGSPYLNIKKYSFVPQPNLGSRFPKHQGKTCNGENLSQVPYMSKIDLSWLLEAYNSTADKNYFFNNYFQKLSGTDALRAQIQSGMSQENIKKSWKKGLEKFKSVRNKYLIYH